MSDLSEIDVKSLKVVDLKEELSKRGLETTGLKKDLADRLQKAQDLALGGGTELAPPGDVTKDEALPPKEIAAAVDGPNTNLAVDPSASNKLHTTAGDNAKDTGGSNGKGDQEGVGHAMVEGAPEASDEINEKVEAEVQRAKEDISQPAALDAEVAEVVKREEVKEQMMEISPSPPRAISPAPVGASKPASPVNEAVEAADDETAHRPANINTPPMPASSLPEENGDGPQHTAKRAREDEPTVPSPSKRLKQVYDRPLPASLSHLRHPPTSTLYITDLRRPMLLSTLYEYISPSSSALLPPPRHPFANEEFPGLWLSGVKDHAYATFPTIDEALSVAERIEGVLWPEDTGAKLHIEFVPDEKVADLIQREEGAWANGRQKLSLQIETNGDDIAFTLKGEGAIGPRAGQGRGVQSAPTRPLSGHPASGGQGVGQRMTGAPNAPTAYGRRLSANISGANTVRPPPGAPTGPSGRGGYGVPPHMARPEPGRFNNGPPGRGGFGGRGGRFDGASKRTLARPSLSWREGPGAGRR